MKFASIRDLRNRPGMLQSTVREETVTLTSNGRPFALVVGLEAEEDPVELERLIRLARAQRAVSRIRARAQGRGVDDLSPAEIDGEIRAVRAGRRK
jgi:prevent-host-death family protein